MSFNIAYHYLACQSKNVNDPKYTKLSLFITFYKRYIYVFIPLHSRSLNSASLNMHIVMLISDIDVLSCRNKGRIKKFVKEEFRSRT